MSGTLPNVPDGQFVTCLTNQTILKNRMSLRLLLIILLKS